MAQGKKINDELVLYMKNQGLTNQEIAEYFGVNITTISKILNQKYKGQYTTQKAGRYDKIILTPEQINHIKSLKAQGYSLQEIANMTGFSKTFIYKTLKNN